MLFIVIVKSKIKSKVVFFKKFFEETMSMGHSFECLLILRKEKQNSVDQGLLIACIIHSYDFIDQKLDTFIWDVVFYFVVTYSWWICISTHCPKKKKNESTTVFLFLNYNVFYIKEQSRYRNICFEAWKLRKF